ncbi:hypothetical protein [Pseudolabrys taiwanensis]|nr:hypothetical protein [Pseudolabrys taiwanensis]
MLDSPLDPACTADTFCEGIGNITRRGDNFRVTCVAERERDGEVERLVVAHLVWSRDDLATAIRQMQAALDGRPFMSAIRPAENVTLC